MKSPMHTANRCAPRKIANGAENPAAQSLQFQQVTFRRKLPGRASTSHHGPNQGLQLSRGMFPQVNQIFFCLHFFNLMEKNLIFLLAGQMDFASWHSAFPSISSGKADLDQEENVTLYIFIFLKLKVSFVLLAKYSEMSLLK
jgi:hypothetical protein